MKLAPSWELVHTKEDEPTYRRLYDEQVLSRLNPRHVADELEGKILLCREAPGAFCHRRIVADWVEGALHIKVPERAADVPKFQTDLGSFR